MIAFNNIDLKYGNRKIFNNLSFQVKAGEKAIITGRSGLGKSSLFSLILGFVRPQKGGVFFQDRLIDEKNIWEVRRKIAFIDQDVSLGSGKVSDWLDFIAGLKVNAGLEFRGKKIRDLFNFFELESGFFDKVISQLSGGERQRLALVAAIALEREVFLLDEATSSLDKRLKNKVADFFTKQKRSTLVVISHDSAWLNGNRMRAFDLESQIWKP